MLHTVILVYVGVVLVGPDGGTYLVPGWVGVEGEDVGGEDDGDEAEYVMSPRH